MRKRMGKVGVVIMVAGSLGLAGCGDSMKMDVEETETIISDTQIDESMEEQEMMKTEKERDLPEHTTLVTVSLDELSPFHEGRFEGWGTSFCWWANRIGYSDELSTQAAEAFYDKEKGLGLNIIRYNIGGGDDPTHDHITRTDSMVPGYAVHPDYDENNGSYTWEYDWTADENQRNVLLKAMEVCGDEVIVEAFSNSAPYFMTKSGCSSGNLVASMDNLREDAYDAFATYLADVMEHFETEWDVPIESVSAMNEPYTDYWGAMSSKQEGCHFEPGASQSNMILAMDRALQAKGLEHIRISGTDETSIDMQSLTYRQLSEEAKAAVDRIDTHAYMGSKRKALKELAVSEQKNLWMSEVDGGDVAGENAGAMGAALWFANAIMADMNEMTPSAWVMWQAIDNHVCQEGYMGRQDSGMPDLHSGYWGLAVADHDAVQLVFGMKYYAFGQFSRYIRPGAQIIGGGDHTLAAYHPKDHELVIVAVNDTAAEKDYFFDLSDMEGLSGEARVIRTSGDMETGEKWAELDPVIIEANGMSVTLKENSITTYVIKTE